MRAIILAGGFGTRLSEVTDAIPKPMIEVGGHPLLWHIMKFYAAQGIEDFAVALGYKSEVIKLYFMQYAQARSDFHIDLATGTLTSDTSLQENWRIDLVDTGSQTMTGGRLKRLRNHIDGTFFFTYGDGLSDVNLKALLKFHKSHGKLATVTAVRPPQRFGTLKLKNDQVESFQEKLGNSKEYINGGFFVLEPEVIDYIEGDDTSWELEPCERLVGEGQMMAYRHDGFWQCVDTLHELRLLREMWDSGNAGWKVWD